MSTPKDSNRIAGPRRGISGWWITLAAVIAVLAASGISWALVSNVAAAKAQYTTDMNRIDNSIGHLKDAATAMDSHMSYQDNTVTTRLDGVDGQIAGIGDDLNANWDDHDVMNKDISGIKDGLASTNSSLAAVKAKADATDTKVTSLDSTINDSTNGLKVKMDALTTSTGKIAGLQVIPTLTSSTGGGTINLDINSTQTVDSQLVAFKVEFRPTSDVAQSATMDASLAALYAAPPVTLNPGGSSSTAVPATNTNYSLYWASGAYHLSAISFTTYGTSVAKGSQTKTMAFTYIGSTAYEVTVTPLFEAAVTSSGGTATTW